MVTAKYVPDVPREKIIEVMELFDKELRDSPERKGWEDRRSHKYAVKHEGRLYPEKEIICLATGVSRGWFAGGPEAIGYLEERGFIVVRLKREKEDFSFEFGENDLVEGIAGTTWRGKLALMLKQDLSELTGAVIGGGSVYGRPELLFSDKRFSIKFRHPKFSFRLAGEKREYEYGLYIEKGISSSNNPEEIMDEGWSWWRLIEELRNDVSLDRFKSAIIDNGLEIYLELYWPDEIITFIPKDGMLHKQDLSKKTTEDVSWDDFVEYISSLPETQWCDLFIRKTGKVGDDRRISVEPIIDSWNALAPVYYSLLDGQPTGGEVFLINATKDISEIDVRRDFINLHKRVAMWVSHPIHDDFVELFKRQQPFKWLIYSKGQIHFEMRVVAFETKKGSEGMVTPWPENTLLEERDKKSLSDKKPEIFKTWLLVDKISRLDPPTKLTSFVRYSDGSPIPPVAMKAAFAYAKKRKEPVTIYDYFSSRGFHFPNEVITDYCISLKTKPFVILSGISGTGKTKIAQIFADYMCPKEDVEVSEVPENGESEFYINVGRQIMNASQLNIPVLLAEYFDIPEKGSAKEIIFEFGDQEVQVRLMNIGFEDPKYSRMLLIYLRKRVMQWIRENFSLGDYIEVTVLDEDRTRYRLEKFEPKKRVMATSRAVFIPVRPDWMDNRGLLGFYNILMGEYQPTELLKLLLRAMEDPDRPYFVLLDEMNLAKVEYYFADFLSCIESRLIGEDGGMTQEAIRLHDQEEDLEFVDAEGVTYYIPPALQIPRNLYFTGTVNVDETTYMFSPKVLDRANTIEFNEVDLVSYGKGEGFSTGSDFVLIDGTDIRESFENLKLATADDYRNLDEEVQVYLETIHNILRPYYLHFGYRVANEIALYINNSIELTGDDNKLIALDLQIMQKVLPKFHGSREKLEEPLLKLLLLCSGKEEGKDGVQYSQVLREYEETAGNVLFPRAASKIARMLKSLHEQGFVSFVE